MSEKFRICSQSTDLQPGEELRAGFESDPLALLLARVRVLLPQVESFFADDVVIVKLLEYRVKKLVRVFQPIMRR